MFFYQNSKLQESLIFSRNDDSKNQAIVKEFHTCPSHLQFLCEFDAEILNIPYLNKQHDATHDWQHTTLNQRNPRMPRPLPNSVALREQAQVAAFR